MPFHKKEEKSQFNEVETIIGPSVKVEGDFLSQGNVIVEGEVAGSLKTDQNLKIGERARIKANIEAENASIAGQIEGSLKIKNYLEIASTAKITGDIVAQVISVEKGAHLNGLCQIQEEDKEPNQLLVKEEAKE